MGTNIETPVGFTFVHRSSDDEFGRNATQVHYLPVDGVSLDVLESAITDFLRGCGYHFDRVEIITWDGPPEDGVTDVVMRTLNGFDEKPKRKGKRRKK